MHYSVLEIELKSIQRVGDCNGSPVVSSRHLPQTWKVFFQVKDFEVNDLALMVAA